MGSEKLAIGFGDQAVEVALFRVEKLLELATGCLRIT